MAALLQQVDKHGTHVRLLQRMPRACSAHQYTMTLYTVDCTARYGTSTRNSAAEKGSTR